MAYERARRVSRDVLIEEYIDGAEYRCHATATECIGVFRRLLPTVRGDGWSTIAELIASKNELRRANPTTRNAPIPVDGVTETCLTRNGLSLESVAETGLTVIVRDVNGITSGGDSEECLDTVDEALKSTAYRAVGAIPGMGWGGVDLLVESETGRPYVMEVNTNASIYGSMFPTFGTPRDLATLIWRRISALARPEFLGEPESSHSMLQKAWSAGQALDLRPTDHGKVRLSRLLRRELRLRGYEVETWSARIFSAKRGERVLWFSGCVTEREQTRCLRPLYKHGLLRRVLTQAGVPLLSGVPVRTLGDLRRFIGTCSGDVILFPARGGGRRPREITSGQDLTRDLLEGARRWTAQSSPQGARVRIIATPERALVTVVTDQHHLVTIGPQCTEAERVAVLAVRACPGLRWGAVDLVLTMTEAEDKVETHVERMHADPAFSADDVILSGSMTDVLEVIIGEDRRPWAGQASV